MADDNVIKAFLVKIGYVQDEVALKKITTGIATATKAVITFGASITEVAAAVAWGVVRISSNLEKLYFASLRTGDSASNLQAFEFAARRMGASAGQGLSAVESLAAFFRNNPPGTARTALETWFPGLKVDENDPVKSLLDIGKAMQTMDYYQAKMRANAAGLTDEQVWFLRRPGLGSMYDDMRKNLGPNFEKAVIDANKFNNSLALLEIRLEGFGAQVIDVLQNKFGWSLDKLSAWLDKNGETLTTSIVNGLQRFFDFLQKLEPKFEWLLDKLVALDKATNGWSTIILGLTALFPGLITGITGVATALAGLTLGAAGGGAGLLGKLFKLGLPLGAGYWLGKKIDEYTGVSATYSDWASSFGDWLGKEVRMSLFSRTGPGVKSRQNWAMEQFEKMGWSHDQAAGLVANASSESSMNPKAENAGHRGLFQWDAERWGHFETFAKIAGLDPNDPLAQVRFADYELRHGTEQAAGKLLLAAQNAAQAGSIASHYYERPGSFIQDNLRADRAVQIAHETTIHIDGAQEPQEIARQIAKDDERRSRVSAAIVREFASVAQ